MGVARQSVKMKKTFVCREEMAFLRCFAARQEPHPGPLHKGEEEAGSYSFVQKRTRLGAFDLGEIGHAVDTAAQAI